MRAIILFVLFFTATLNSVNAQEYMFVKTETYLHELPDTSSRKFIALLPPCKIRTLEIADPSYVGMTYVTDNWYAVNFFSSDGTRFGGETFKGYIQKKDIIKSLQELNDPSIDTIVTIHYAIIGKNGERTFPPLKFLDSSHGGCYYINSDAKKEYVSGKFCNN